MTAISWFLKFCQNRNYNKWAHKEPFGGNQILIPIFFTEIC